MDTKEKQCLLGLKLKNYRKAAHYTQEKLCAAINIDVSGLSKIENGKCFPSVETLCLIMEELNINPNELFDFIKPNNKKCSKEDLFLIEKIKELSPKEKQKILSFSSFICGNCYIMY